MKKRICFILAVIAVIFMLPFLCQTALATEPDDDEPSDTTVAEITEIIEMFITDETLVMPDMPVTDYPEIQYIQDIPVTDYPEIQYMQDIPVTDYPKTPPLPFTPPGTATVIDNATDKDGKEFYTIKTPDDNVFYLIIDNQRNTENVYFLNAVTVADLMALAVASEPPQIGMGTSPIKPTDASAETADEEPPPPEQEKESGNSGMVFFVVAVVIIGGGAGWYFKIYKPKQQRGAMEEDVDYASGIPDIYDGDDLDDDPDENDTLPWYGDNDTEDDNDGNDDG